MNDRAKSLSSNGEIRKYITQNIRIDSDGYIHVYWSHIVKGEKVLVENVFEDIDTAILQHWHVLWGYIGVEIKAGKSLLRLSGESQEMAQIATKIIDVSKNFLTRELSAIDEIKARTTLEQLLRKLEQVTNENKVRLRERIKGAITIQEYEKEKVALETAQAADDALKRFQEIAEIVTAVRYRLRALIEEKYRSERIFISTYHSLVNVLSSWDKRLPSEKELRKFARDTCTSKDALLNGLRNIVVQPYLKRAQRPLLKRLEKIPNIVQDVINGKRDMDYLKKVLQKAIEEILPVVKEVEQRSPRYPRIKVLKIY